MADFGLSEEQFNFKIQNDNLNFDEKQKMEQNLKEQFYLGTISQNLKDSISHRMSIKLKLNNNADNKF